MTRDSSAQIQLDKLRHRCDALLDESLSWEGFARDAFESVVELEEVDAAALIEFQAADQSRIVVGRNLETISHDNFFSLDPDHISLCLQALRQRRPTLVTDRSVPEAGLKQHSILIHPLGDSQPPLRVLELYQLEAPQPEQVAQLKEVAETLAAYLARYAAELTAQQEPAQSSDFWMLYDRFLQRLQNSLDLKRTVAVAVNDGRHLLECDRVSIAIREGRRTRIRGVSGQEGVQQRANLVRFMARVADVAMDLATPITYRGTIENLPPQLEKPLADYLAESRTRMVKLIPLREQPDKTVEEDQEDRKADKRPEPGKVCGCLIIEQATEARPKRTVIERAELMTPHIEAAIDNCRRHESIFLLTLWRGIGRTIRWFHGRRLWAAAAVLAGLFAIGLSLAFIQWDYRVEGTGIAMPAAQFEVFAPWDGDVRQVQVESGQHVKAGDLLVVLESDELDAQRVALESEMLEKEKLILALAQQEHVARQSSQTDELIRVSTELAKARVEQIGVLEQLETIRKRIQKLTVLAPADGIVATFQVQQLLRNRPVKRGEVLLEIMQPDGDWRLELDVPEYRMGHVMRARQATPHALEVEYVLATEVEVSHDGTLTQIATRSNESQEQGTVFEVYVDINPNDLPARNVGSRVTAKINCGPKSLFYVLFGDVVEFLQQHLWL